VSAISNANGDYIATNGNNASKNNVSSNGVGLGSSLTGSIVND
jgi:hypothetical protein